MLCVMRDLRELGIHFSSQPATEDDLAAIERGFGRPLPEDYKEFLRRHNGGSPRVSVFYPSGSPKELWGVNDFYTTGRGVGSVLFELAEYGLAPQYLPIARDAGDSQIVLNYEGDQTRVGLCIYDENWRYLEVAPTFSAFLDLLHLHDAATP